MINNFNLITPHLVYENPDDDFYICEVIKRRKENPDMPTGQAIIDTFYLYEGGLGKYAEKIMFLCHVNNARAYIRLNRRSAKKVAMRTAQKILELIDNGNNKAAKNAYASAAGENHSDPNKKWLIDIDTKNQIYIDNMAGLVEHIGGKIYLRVPTLNGVHLITSPFNRMEKKWGDHGGLQIHKDNPTILYYFPV